MYQTRLEINKSQYLHENLTVAPTAGSHSNNISSVVQGKSWWSLVKDLVVASQSVKKNQNIEVLGSKSKCNYSGFCIFCNKNHFAGYLKWYLYYVCTYQSQPHQ